MGDYITEPEPHPYQEILEKGNFPEIKENIVKIEKTISNEKIKEDRSPDIWQRNKEDTKKPEVTNLKDRVPDFWHRNKEDAKKPDVVNFKDRVPDFWHRQKVDTKKQEQKQNNMENPECENWNKG